MAKQSDVEWTFDDICIRQRIRPRPRVQSQMQRTREKEEEGGKYKKIKNKERIDNKLILADHMR